MAPRSLPSPPLSGAVLNSIGSEEPFRRRSVSGTLVIGAWLARVSVRRSLMSGVWANSSVQYRPEASPRKNPVSSSAAGLRVTTRPSRSIVTMPLVSDPRMLSV